MKNIELLLKKEKLNVYEMQDFLQFAQKEETENYNHNKYENMITNVFHAIKETLLLKKKHYENDEFSIELAQKKFELIEAFLNIEMMFKVSFKQPFYSKIQENIISNKGNINERHTVNSSSFCSRSLTEGFLIRFVCSDTIIKSKNKYKTFFTKYSFKGSFLQDFQSIETYGNSSLYFNRKKFEKDMIISGCYNEILKRDIWNEINKEIIIDQSLDMFKESEIVAIKKQTEHYTLEESITFYLLINKIYLYINEEKISKYNLDLYELETDILIK